MTSSRPLRVLLVANDGLGAGHVTRSLAIAKALACVTSSNGTDVELLLATTSEADRLIASQAVPCVRWPAPLSARRAGFSDASRRALGSELLRGVFSGFRPDLLVVDTFPRGPHGELSGLLREAPKRALIRRSVRRERAKDPILADGLEDYDLAIVPDDPGEHRPEILPIPSVRVPPITLFEADERFEKSEARARLGLPREGRAILVGSGGGGDEEAIELAAHVAETIARRAQSTIPVFAQGPLVRRRNLPTAVKVVSETPLEPLLSAFDGAIVPAGYNMAHELAKAGVPMVLFARPRPYDDQEARAERFESKGLARVLPDEHKSTLLDALSWMESAPRPSIEAGGAERAALSLMNLVLGRVP